MTGGLFTSSYTGCQFWFRVSRVPILILVAGMVKKMSLAFYCRQDLVMFYYQRTIHRSQSWISWIIHIPIAQKRLVTLVGLAFPILPFKKKTNFGCLNSSQTYGGIKNMTLAMYIIYLYIYILCYYIILYDVMLCYVMLGFIIMLCFVLLYYYIILYHIISYYIISYYIISYDIISYDIISYYIILYYIILYHIISYYIILHYIMYIYLLCTYICMHSPISGWWNHVLNAPQVGAPSGRSEVRLELPLAGHCQGLGFNGKIHGKTMGKMGKAMDQWRFQWKTCSSHLQMSGEIPVKW